MIELPADTKSIERQLLDRYRSNLEAARRNRVNVEADAATRISEAQAQEMRWERAISGLEAAIQEAPAASTTTDEAEAAQIPRNNGKAARGPRGEAAVAVILDEQVGHHWPVRELTAEMQRRGWGPEGSKDPAAAVRAAGNRLRAKLPDRYGFTDGAFVALYTSSSREDAASENTLSLDTGAKA